MTVHALQYGTTTIQYELRYAARKTLGITVRPDDLHVVVKAPQGAPLEAVEKKVLKRAAWILKQQRDLARYLPHLPPRQYVSGETHRYLGRQHRLKVLESANGAGQGVERDRNYIYVHVSDKTDTASVKALLDDWYHEHARRVFQARLAACYPKVAHIGVPYPDIVVRAMRTRWGSCSAQGKITLNVKLVKVPKSYIDYVIFHELCHLAAPDHTPRFYALLDRVLPDWRERRERLNLYEFG
jgi:predicted metal-dependent hydrolase